MRNIEKHHLKAAIASVVIIILILVVWFGTSLRDSNYKRKLKEASSTKQTAPATIQPESSPAPIEQIVTFTVDPIQSSLIWTGNDYLGQNISGTVAISSGSIILDPVNKIFGSGSVLIDMQSIQPQEETVGQFQELTDKLKGVELFDVTSYPTAALEIQSIQPLDADPVNNAIINATLTIKSVTQPISFPAVINATSNQIQGSAKIKIDRTAWGVTYGSSKFPEQIVDQIISDELEFQVNLVAHN